MLSYLAKKIVLPNQNTICSLSWNHENDLIACGCDLGLLKLIKLNSNYKLDLDNFTSSLKKNEDSLQSSNEKNFLNFNQNLDGHANKIEHVIWNKNFNKLISSDENGLVIVWMFEQNQWFKEMLNNQNKNKIIDIKWSKNGNFICIAYEDGTVIVGSAEGERLCTKEIKTIKLTCLEWSPDSKFLLFGSNNSQIHCYDYNGNYLSKIILYSKNSKAITNSSISSQASVVSIKWNKTRNFFTNRNFVVALSNGQLCFFLKETDEQPLIVDTYLVLIYYLEWNTSGTIVSVCGKQEFKKNEYRNCTLFYSSDGKLKFNLKLPGKNVACCAWSKTDLQLAIGIEDNIYFANIRPFYVWTFFMDTFVFSFTNQIQNLDKENKSKLIFFQTKTKKLIEKNISNLFQVSSKNKFCTLITFCNKQDNNRMNLNSGDQEDNHEMKCTLYLCNSIGSSIDAVNLEFKLNCLTMNSSHVIAASNESFCIWKFRVPFIESNYEKNSNKEKFNLIESNQEEEDLENFDRLFNVYLSHNETINCIDCTEKLLVIGQDNGNFYTYNLPKANFIAKLNLINFIPKKVELNFDSSKLAVLDIDNNLKLFDLNQSFKNILSLSFNNVWDFKWSQDTLNELILIQKSEILLLDLNQLENKVSLGFTNGYLSKIKNLTVNIVLLDKLIQDYSEKNFKNFDFLTYFHLFEYEKLQETKLLFQKQDLKKINEFIELNPHPKLLKLLTKTSLDSMNLDIAELSAIGLRDFKCIQFIKNLRKLTDTNLQKAEIHLYYGELNEAEKIYTKLDRIDLISNMYELFGEWEKLLDLYQVHGFNLDLFNISLNSFYDELGYFYKNKFDYKKAINYFKLNSNFEQLKECYLYLEEFDEIINLIDSNNEILSQDVGLACLLESIGACDEAIKIYLNCGLQQKAVDCAIRLNEWKHAIQLTEQFSFYNIDNLIDSCVHHLSSKNNYIAIVELYRKAKQYSKAIKYLLFLIQKFNFKTSDLIQIKKIYTMIGLLFEEKKDQTNSKLNKQDKLNQLLINEFSDNLDQKFTSKQNFNLILDQPWIGAEAFHFYFLAQKQLNQGYLVAAMKTALLLIDYEHFIEPIQIYSLIALTSALNKNFAICSKAFIKLESIENQQLVEENLKENKSCFNDDFDLNKNLYKNYAMKIFTKHSPKQVKNNIQVECPYCESLIDDWNNSCPNCETKFTVCIASGRKILQLNQQWTCYKCKHHAYKKDLIIYKNCPLCHTPFN